MSGLAALQRKLERLARAKGPPTDVEALVQDGKLNAALVRQREPCGFSATLALLPKWTSPTVFQGARLRRQPAYLRSCSPAAGAPSTPITPLRLVRPNSTDVKEELLPPAFADLPNAITSPKRANQRLFVSAHNDGEVCRRYLPGACLPFRLFLTSASFCSPDGSPDRPSPLQAFPSFLCSFFFHQTCSASFPNRPFAVHVTLFCPTSRAVTLPAPDPPTCITQDSALQGWIIQTLR